MSDKGSLERALATSEKQFLKDAKVKLYKSGHHIRDFIDAVGKRSKPITNEIVGARSAIACHLMNQAYYHGETSSGILPRTSSSMGLESRSG